MCVSGGSPWRPERDIGSLRTSVLSCHMGVGNLAAVLHDQQVLVTTEPSLQSSVLFLCVPGLSLEARGSVFPRAGVTGVGNWLMKMMETELWFLYKSNKWGWKNDWAVKSIGCSSRRPGFNSQHPHGAHDCLTLSSDTHTHTYTQAKYHCR